MTHPDVSHLVVRDTNEQIYSNNNNNNLNKASARSVMSGLQGPCYAMHGTVLCMVEYHWYCLAEAIANLLDQTPNQHGPCTG